MPFTARIGLALILMGIACYGGWTWWDATRTWVPLSVPLSLSRGHVRTAEFQINVESYYDIQIDVNRGADFWGVPCLIRFDACNGDPAPLEMSWSLTSGGQVVATGTSDGQDRAIVVAATIGRVLGGFQAAKGRYVLDLDIRQDGSRLNGGAPRLMVVERGDIRWSSNDAGSAVFLLSSILSAVGAYLAVRPALMRRRERLAALARNSSLTQPGQQPCDLGGDREPLAPAMVHEGFRLPSSVYVGAALILAGLAIYASIQHWIATRRYVALDMPVSLVPGHIRSGPFEINLAEYYSVSLDRDASQPNYLSCTGAAKTARWLLYRDGQIVDGSEGTDGNLGIIEGRTGFYDLNLEVLKGASCLNGPHRKLRVAAVTSAYADFTSLFLWLSTLGIGAGCMLLTIGGAERLRRQPPAVDPGAALRTITGSVRWKRRPSKTLLLSGVSFFGHVATMFLYLIVIVMMLSTIGMVPKGLRVHLVRPGIVAPIYPGIRPILVEIDSSHRLHVDSESVAWQDLNTVLHEKLKLRPPSWPIYLRGDPDLEFGWPIKAVDIIQGLHAEVTLLAPARPASRRGDAR